MTKIKFSDEARAALEVAGFEAYSDEQVVDHIAEWMVDGVEKNLEYNKPSPTLAEDWINGWEESGLEVVGIYANGPYAEDDAERWGLLFEHDDIETAVADEICRRMKDLTIKSFKNEIDDAVDLDTLVCLLKAADAYAKDNGMDRHDIYDATNLPMFGDKAIKDTANIFSWDDSRYLTYLGEGWHVSAREDLNDAA